MNAFRHPNKGEIRLRDSFCVFVLSGEIHAELFSVYSRGITGPSPTRTFAYNTRRDQFFWRRRFEYIKHREKKRWKFRVKKYTKKNNTFWRRFAASVTIAGLTVLRLVLFIFLHRLTYRLWLRRKLPVKNRRGLVGNVSFVRSALYDTTIRRSIKGDWTIIIIIIVFIIIVIYFNDWFVCFRTTRV